MRATLSALLAALALASVGVPAEAGIGMGLGIGWLIAAATPDQGVRTTSSFARSASNRRGHSSS